MKTVNLNLRRSFIPVMNLSSKTTLPMRETCVCPAGSGRCSRCPLPAAKVIPPAKSTMVTSRD